MLGKSYILSEQLQVWFGQSVEFTLVLQKNQIWDFINT